VSQPRRKILVATGDVLEAKMAGPAIRAWQIAIALSREHEVRLVSTLACDLTHPDFAAGFADASTLPDLVAQCDIIVFQGNLMAQHPAVRTTSNVVVVDIYDPFHLEVLEQSKGLAPVDRLRLSRSTTTVLNEQLGRGDFFLCASGKQRDFWLGQLAGMGRINHATYDDDENLRSLIATVPFGVSDSDPSHTRRVLKGVHPGIGVDDKVVLWGGGVYNWFDPLTLLRAMARLTVRLPNVRLYFLGLKHPNPHVGEMSMAVQTRALADELQLTGTHVFFNEDWVPYEDRQNYLLESDVGVSTHFDHVETAFSFRTRILDYFWAGLPVVSTSGDALSDMIEVAGAGIAVPPNDIGALQDALFDLLSDEQTRSACAMASAKLADELTWSRALEPLLEFCRSPRRAPDLVDPLFDTHPSARRRGRRLVDRVRRDLEIAAVTIRRRDFRELLVRARNRVRVLTGRA
jgi:glycosyltransferase involved in cell wall biosynthesis